jgi:hypothetical protein
VRREKAITSLLAEMHGAAERNLKAKLVEAQAARDAAIEDAGKWKVIHEESLGQFARVRLDEQIAYQQSIAQSHEAMLRIYHDYVMEQTRPEDMGTHAQIQ